MAIHKLCDILNRHGIQAALIPLKRNTIPGFLSYLTASLRMALSAYDKFTTNPTYVTPIIPPGQTPRLDEGWIVIYPEITYGNPLFAQNVVRWLLHEPGFFTGRTGYGAGELYFRFREDRSSDFSQAGSKLAPRILTVNDYPLHLYNRSGIAAERSGTAYCLRKGKGRLIRHELSNSVLIDGKGHEEIARIFKSVAQFISYDANTSYLKFAALCGCDVIVIPDPGVTEEQWKPNLTRRYGVAYGFDRLEWARSTAHLVDGVIRQELEEQERNVLACVEDMNRYFDAALP